jgi:hypothetical protein
MRINFKIVGAVVRSVRRYGTIEHRPVPRQVEYWSQIGKVAAENPASHFNVILDIIIVDQEEPVFEYRFR